MERTIELNPDYLMDRETAYDYLQELFQFETPTHTLDALLDSMSEVRDDCDLILTREAIEKICGEPYAYKILMILGKASEENPHLHVLFR